MGRVRYHRVILSMRVSLRNSRKTFPMHSARLSRFPRASRIIGWLHELHTVCISKRDISEGAWSAPAQNLVQYIPAPNLGDSIFSSGASSEIVRDDKGGLRVDTGTTRLGQFSAYYFYDNYYVDNPYPTGQGGASIPDLMG